MSGNGVQAEHGEWTGPMSSDVEDEINRLYQLPLSEFTAARNALAKRLGPTEPPIKTLQKPVAPAWAVNQLYWKHRGVYDRLIEAAERLRAAHRKVLAGKSSDLRAAETAHREAMRAVLERVQAILDEGGQPSTPATQRAVSETLEALPSAEPPGRLSRPLKPLGFEALAGVKVTPASLHLVKGRLPAQPAVIDRAAAKRAAAAERREAEAARRQEAKEKERHRAKLAAQRKAEVAVERAKMAFDKAEQESERRRVVLQQARDELARLRRLT